MIKKVCDFTHKSFKEFTGPEDDFRKINVIFGYNGTGKTALSNGIKEEFLKSNDENDLRVYSTEYSKVIVLDETNREKLRGVKVSFGEVDVDIEKQIKELEKKLVSKEQIDKLKSENEKKEVEIKDEIEKIFKLKKDKLNIQNKSKTLKVNEIIERYRLDYMEALKVEPDKEKIQATSGDDTIENKIINMESLEKLEIISEEPSFYSNLEKFQNAKISDIEIPSSQIIDWLSEGLEIHFNKEKCEFCGSPISYNDIKEKIQSYVSNVKYDAETFFYNQYEFWCDILKKIKKFIGNKKMYENVIDSSVSQFFKEIEKDLTFFEEVINKFHYNAKNIIAIDKIDVKIFEDKLKSINENIKKINSVRLKNIAEEKNKLSKLGTIVKGSIYMAIGDSTFIKDRLNDLNVNNKSILEKESENINLETKIKELKEMKSVTSDFMNLVNQTLKDLEISIKLEIEDNDYILRTTLLTEDQLTIDDISEGEKNLLSLLFFYYEMFEDREQKRLKNNIKLIILDDPISSMDDSNRFYVLEIVQNLMELDVDQVFVLTHVWDDFSQLIYGKNSFKNGSKYASYEIKKDKKSYLIKNISKGSPYKHMFEEVYAISQKKQLSTDCEYYHMPNIIRKVFEEFLFFKTHNNSFLPQRNNKKHIEDIFKIESTKDKRDLGTLLSVINVLSHTNTKTNNDILIAAKFLMKIIKNNDEIHYKQLKPQ
ncbi:MAG: AAA family ATPase [Bacilli bacterium]